jgi:hypothetical protein
MPDSRFSSTSAVQDATQTDTSGGCTVEVAQLPAATGTASEGKYFARSPRGTHVEIPRELFIALSDFLATRRYPGAINIQFHSGMIVCIEAVAKKTYR